MRRYILSALVLLTITTMIYSCQSAEQIKQDMYFANGRDLYVKRCQNCHGQKAEGLANLIPPLTDARYLKKNKNKLACIIKNGLNEKIIVNNREFSEKMPAQSDLNDIDIAQIIVYLTNSNGSKQGMYNTEAVTADLKKCK
ncbi:MAG: copper oxidase [Pedobacter sp.]|jgi:mono/diheme cytochrome c family protein|nr:copper oxidase [Pedobacter sp.]